MLRRFTASIAPILAACVALGCEAPTAPDPSSSRTRPPPETNPAPPPKPADPAAQPEKPAPSAPQDPASPAPKPNTEAKPAPTDASAPAAKPASTPRKEPEYLVASWYEVGSNAATNLYQLSPLLINKGWKGYLFEAPHQGARSIFQEVTKFGSDEVIFHRPFGEPPTSKHMNLGSYILAKRDPRLSKVTDIFGFVDAFTEFYKRTGRKRLTFYFGYLVGADEPWRGKTRDEKIALVKECLSPVKALRDKISDDRDPSPVRVAIDSFGDKDPSRADWDDFLIVIQVCKAWNLPLDAEPWPEKNSPLIEDENTRFIVVEHFIKHAETGAWAAPRNRITGRHRIIPYMYAAPPEEKRDSITRAVAHLRKEGAVAWAGWDMSITAAELKRRAASGK